jgi:threonine synthase
MKVTMGEGNTPLVESRRIAPGELYFKLETTNPSGSYKDRFIAAELAHILDNGARACVATSSGNTGSSLATYCARYGLPCVILVNADAPSGKLVQMRAHGAIVVRIPEFVTSSEITQSVFAQLNEFVRSGTAALVVSAFAYCPVGMSGVQSIATEIAAQLADVEHEFVPVGGGGLFSAVYRGFLPAARRPKVHAVQPEGCPTLLDAVRQGRDTIQPVTSTTRISGLSVPFDIDASLALRLLREGGGHALGVSDEEVLQAQRALMRQEGIYSEPAGATALAGYWKAVAEGVVSAGERCVCLVTGHGFKDPMSAESVARDVESPVVAARDVLAALGRLIA